LLASYWKKVPVVANLRNSFIQVTITGEYCNISGIFGIMSNQLQARWVNGTSMPSKIVNDTSNAIKISIIILLLVAIPVVYHIPFFQYGIHHVRHRFVRYYDFTTEHLFPNLDSFVYIESNRISDKKRKITKIESSSDFKPSITILSRILQAIMETKIIGRTALSHETNLNYTVLSQYLDWMKNKSLIEAVIVNYKAYLQLSENGLSFALQINKLNGQFVNFIDKS
jgi:predicted transcriptional regulator